MLRQTFLLLVLAVLTGCHTPVPPKKAAEDPVESLRTAVRRGIEKNKLEGWSFSEPSVDARKTDSLISPYEGTVTFRAFGKPMEPGSRDTYDATFLVVFAYEGGRWVVKDGKYKTEHHPYWSVYEENAVLPGSPIRTLVENFK